MSTSSSACAYASDILLQRFGGLSRLSDRSQVSQWCRAYQCRCHPGGSVPWRKDATAATAGACSTLQSQTNLRCSYQTACWQNHNVAGAHVGPLQAFRQGWIHQTRYVPLLIEPALSYFLNHRHCIVFVYFSRYHNILLCQYQHVLPLSGKHSRSTAP